MIRWLVRPFIWLALFLVERLGKLAESTSDPALLDVLAQIRYDEVRTPVQLNPATRPETLRRVLADANMWGNEEERVHIAHNPSLPLDALVGIMRSDASSCAQAAAACALAKRLARDPHPNSELVAECTAFLLRAESGEEEFDGMVQCLELLRAVPVMPLERP